MSMKNRNRDRNKPSWQLLSLLAICLLTLFGFAMILSKTRISAADSVSLKIHLPLVSASRSNSHIPYAIVFVSRQIPNEGSVYWNEPNGMAGVGAYSRFQVAAPGKLQVREPGGSIRTLIDGENPAAAPFGLIDVNAPDVSFDATKIVFAGFSASAFDSNDTRPNRTAGGWRIYVINVDGTDLRQVTNSDFSYSQLDMSRFGEAASVFAEYDDTDPVWLPDGRIVFSSTRWPSIAHYSGVRATNLHVVNLDGSEMRRITSERNGAERPLVDPVTGQIVYARWWRNHRFAVNGMDTIMHPGGGYVQHDGLTIERNHVGRYMNLWTNHWQAAAVNPDGTGLVMWGGRLRGENDNHYYGGAFTRHGELIANFFPMSNMSEAAGFGGLRRLARGAGKYVPLIGITDIRRVLVSSAPPSYGIYQGTYAAEPDVLPDGRIIFSWAHDIYQDYGLYVMQADGTEPHLLYDSPGTAELRARLIRQRPLPPVLPDTITQTPGPLPPPAGGPYDQDGTFIFENLNVYFNAPVDTEIVNAPAIGSAAVIRFFIDQQRTNRGSFPNLDWPILIGELPVNPNGSLTHSSLPANVPLFEQIRAADGTVPITNGPQGIDGAAHVTGMNFGRPGEHVTCVGCHAGHSMISIPATVEEARWTNLAPGAAVTVSSTRDANHNRGLIDRQVMNGPIYRYWISAPGQTGNQWVKLTFPVPVVVRVVRLYNPRYGDEANSSITVNSATVRLYSDAGGTNEVASSSVGQLSVLGTDVAFNDVTARVIRVELNNVTGTFYGVQSAGLAEIEVIARGQ
jgi:hypothetical protein